MVVLVLIVFQKVCNQNTKITWQYYVTEIWTQLIAVPSVILGIYYINYKINKLINE